MIQGGCAWSSRSHSSLSCAAFKLLQEACVQWHHMDAQVVLAACKLTARGCCSN